MDEYGVIPEELEKALEANKSHRPREITQRKPFWSLLYLMPTFHNPTGICLPPGKEFFPPDMTGSTWRATVYCGSILPQFEGEYVGSVPEGIKMSCFENLNHFPGCLLSDSGSMQS